MKKTNVAILAIICILLSSGFAGSVNVKKDIDSQKISTNTSGRWTILVYLDGDNNLEKNAIDDFNEMASAGSTSEVSIVVQMDRVSGYDYRYGDWTGTKRYLVNKYMQPTSNNAIMDLGEANMGDPQTLVDFVNWGISNYPADKYFLIIWDHGSGWKNSEGYDRKGICEDQTDYDRMTTAEMANAFKTITANGASKLEMVGFDACLMGMIEIAYELEPYAKYMVASEETEPVRGWSYNDSLGSLIKNPMMNAEQLGAQFVNCYKGYQLTLATTNLQLIDGLVDEIDGFTSSIIGNERYRPIIEYAFEQVETFYDYDFADFYHFVELCMKFTEDAYIQSAAQTLMLKFSAAVTSEKHDIYHKNVHGLSVYLPYYGFDTDYNNLRFAQDTNWDEMINWIKYPPASNSPSRPTIQGPVTGSVNDALQYTFKSEDPDADPVYYFVDWGYNFETSFIGPRKSGEAASDSFVWYYEGAFVVKAMAVDEYGACSDWAYLTISVPKQKSLSIFDGVFNNFPLLKSFFNSLI